MLSKEPSYMMILTKKFLEAGFASNLVLTKFLIKSYKKTSVKESSAVCSTAALLSSWMTVKMHELRCPGRRSSPQIPLP